MSLQIPLICLTAPGPSKYKGQYRQSTCFVLFMFVQSYNAQDEYNVLAMFEAEGHCSRVKQRLGPAKDSVTHWSFYLE